MSRFCKLFAAGTCISLTSLPTAFAQVHSCKRTNLISGSQELAANTVLITKAPDDLSHSASVALTVP
jgi:hypothetical protein